MRFRRIFRICSEHIDLAVESKTEIASVRCREESDRILFEMSNLFRSPDLPVFQREIPNVQRAALLREIKEGDLVRCPDRVTVFAGIAGEFGMVPGCDIE